MGRKWVTMFVCLSMLVISLQTTAFAEKMIERPAEQNQKSSEQVSNDSENHSMVHLSLHNIRGGVFAGDLMKEMPFKSFSESETLAEREMTK